MTHHNLMEFLKKYRPALESDLAEIISQNISQETPILTEMVRYHFGWLGEGAGIGVQGKRVRPLFLLLCVEACGGDWHASLPAATAVELLHNFSLIHDDVEDKSEQRRSRPTMWLKYGINQAINTGDFVFALAQISLQRMLEKFPLRTYFDLSQVLLRTSVQLTHGQHLDLLFQDEPEMEMALYWKMIQGKTAAMLAACTEMAGIITAAPENQRMALRNFGESLGLAFQVRDDWLGIWGKPEETGKSATSDLVSGKKTYPVLQGLKHSEEFARRWRQGNLREAEAIDLAEVLTRDGIQTICQQKVDELTTSALQWMDKSIPRDNEAGDILREFVAWLLIRKQ